MEEPLVARESAALSHPFSWMAPPHLVTHHRQCDFPVQRQVPVVYWFPSRTGPNGPSSPKSDGWNSIVPAGCSGTRARCSAVNVSRNPSSFHALMVSFTSICFFLSFVWLFLFCWFVPTDGPDHADICFPSALPPVESLFTAPPAARKCL